MKSTRFERLWRVLLRCGVAAAITGAAACHSSAPGQPDAGQGDAGQGDARQPCVLDVDTLDDGCVLAP